MLINLKFHKSSKNFLIEKIDLLGNIKNNKYDFK